MSGAALEAVVPRDPASRAASVYHLFEFVSWPAESPFSRSPTLTIGILGDDSLADAVEVAVRNRTVDGRPLGVRRFRDTSDVAPCPVLFVGREQAGSIEGIVARLRGWPVLIASDAASFAARGGAIGLFVEDAQTRVEVDLSAAEAAGLRVSSKLLRLARPPSRASGRLVASGYRGR